jgi:hypothetical protein
MRHRVNGLWAIGVVAGLLATVLPVATYADQQTATSGPVETPPAAEPPLTQGNAPWDPLAGRLSIDVRSAAPADVFASFEEVLWETLHRRAPKVERSTVRIVVDAAVREPVSICLQNVTLRTAITAVCESIACTWRFEAKSEPLRVQVTVHPLEGEGAATPDTAVKGKAPASLDEPIQAQLESADAATVFGVLARITGYQVVLAPELSTRKLKLGLEAPLREVLDAACAQIDCSWSVTGGVLTIRAGRS